MSFGENPKQTPISKYTGFSYEGKPITLTKKPGPPLEQPRHKLGWYSEEKKIEAATMWAATRSWATTADLTGVNLPMLKRWAKEPWWQNIVERVVKDKNDELDGALTDIIHECQTQIKTRLVAGDPKVNFKTGDVFYVPLDVRALTMSLAILFDKRQLVRGEATSRTESISADKRLEHLKAEFEKFSKATTLEGELVGEPQEAITDETNS